MDLKDLIKEFGEKVGTQIWDLKVNGWTDQTTCPDCGGSLFERWDGYLECEDCGEQYAVGDDGVLFTETYND